MNWIGHWFGQWFGQAGDSPPGSIAGTAGISLGAAAQLTGRGAMTGATTLVLGATGELSVPSGEMVGTASLSLDAAGALQGLGALAGATTLALGATGILSVFGAVEEAVYEGATSGAGEADDELMEIAAMLVASGALEQLTVKGPKWRR